MVSGIRGVYQAVRKWLRDRSFEFSDTMCLRTLLAGIKPVLRDWCVQNRRPSTSFPTPAPELRRFLTNQGWAVVGTDTIRHRVTYIMRAMDFLVGTDSLVSLPRR